MLREFELTVITKADLPETETSKVLSRYEALMTSENGQILKKDVWGAKKLAFPMKKQYRGVYTNYDFVTKPDNIAEIERLMRIDDNVLKYLTIRIGENVDVVERKAELAKLASKEREQAQRMASEED